jgi:hypothetical protein
VLPMSLLSWPDTTANVACCVLAFLIDEGGDVGQRVARALATCIDEGFCAGVSPYWAEFLTTQAMSAYVPAATLQVCASGGACRVLCGCTVTWRACGSACREHCGLGGGGEGAVGHQLTLWGSHCVHTPATVHCLIPLPLPIGRYLLRTWWRSNWWPSRAGSVAAAPPGPPKTALRAR